MIFVPGNVLHTAYFIKGSGMCYSVYYIGTAVTTSRRKEGNVLFVRWFGKPCQKSPSQ